ncbi:MAG: TIGR00266 family protein [Vampirovibrionia bacterium]
MNYEISGVISQSVKVDLEPGEYCWIAPGGMIYYTGYVDWSVKIPGGLKGAVNRMMSGENFKMTQVRAENYTGSVTFNSSQPGKIYPWNLENGPIITTRGSFIGAAGDIEISVSIAKKAGAAIFGGAGLILQTISGEGIVFIHGCGDFIEKDLKAAESVYISSGNLAAFSKSADYDIKCVGNINKTLFGGEGLFMTKITGPGKVLLQSIKEQQQMQLWPQPRL